MISNCPGAQSFKQPKPEIIKCPSCAVEVEIWTDEVQATCKKCKNKVIRPEGQSCLDWCKYAKECVGEKNYSKYIKNKKGGREMAEEWTCQEDILCGVNQPKDKYNLTDLEQKHMPIIEAPDEAKKEEAFDATIEVGKLLAHPNEAAHFIEWIELYCGDTFLARISLSGGASVPKVTVPVKLSHAHGPLKAWAKCNIHGLWESTKDIKVS